MNITDFINEFNDYYPFERYIVKTPKSFVYLFDDAQLTEVFVPSTEIKPIVIDGQFVGHTKVPAVVANYNDEGKQLTGKQLFNVLKKVCKDGVTVMTDQYSGYNILDKENEKNFIRVKVDHSVTYSLGDGKHTNGIESFWAIVKRGVYGVYHHISVEHMQKYMDEFCFRLNHRECDDAFESLVNLAIAA